ncbi:MAG TPA: pseudouridine synthase, partial [Myxococcaceae bacterium]|nr:pseudouridine synthase [Myxococcaceae bacterium]
MSERLQKFLARAGVASRRHAEGLITAGRVSVNNQRVTELGTKVEPTDLVTVDGKLVTVPEHTSWYLLHKPPGVVTTLSDPEGRPTVAGLLEGVEQRVFPVGRLDWDAEGALLLTNDGGAAHRLLHPSFEVPRTYLVKVKGSPSDETLERLREGVRLEDGPARAIRAERFEATERNTWLLLQVGEGRPHLVKRLCAAVGHPVVRLFRPAQAGISVAGLQPGELRTLTADEVQRVEAVAAGDTVPEPAPFLPPRRHGRAGDEDESLEAGEGSGTFGAPARTEASSGRAGAPERGSRPRGRDIQRGRFNGAPSRGAGAADGGLRPGGRDTARFSGGPSRRAGAPEGGFRPRRRDTEPGPSGGEASHGAGAPEGDFRPRGRDTGRSRFSGRPSGGAGASERGFRPRGRGTGPSRFGGASRGAGAPEGEFRPRGRDTGRGRFGGGASGGADAPEGEFGPRGRDTGRGRFSGRPSGGAGASERGFRPRGRGTGPSRFGGASRGAGAPEGEFRPRERDTGRGRFSGRAPRETAAPEGGFRPRGRDAGRGRFGRGPSRAAGAAEGGFRPRGRDTQRG